MNVAEYQKLLERQNEAQLKNYLALVSDCDAPFRPKEINDAVWGTISVSPLEALFIDSPNIQRLRRIKQLGVVHWVYPSAAHSRFEHTLGVLYQVQQLIDALNSQVEVENGTPGPIDSTLSQILRLSALHHDIGHGPFSHVSEHPLEAYTEVQELLEEFAEFHDLERAKLSEVTAYLLITSNTYVQFTEALFGAVADPPRFGSKSAEHAKEACTAMADAIIGKSITTRIPLVQEMLNGPFDADKLDYMTRDAMLCGVPRTVDISRLTQKLAARSVRVDNLPGPLQRLVTDGHESISVMGLKSSGAAVLDELLLGRALLFSKVYRHHKVRAAEAMIESAFRCLEKIIGVDPLLSFYSTATDDDLINTSPANLTHNLKEKGLSVHDSRTSRRCRKLLPELMRRLRQRELFVKAVVIQSEYPGENVANDTDLRLGLKLLIQDLAKPDEIRNIKDQIVAETEKVIHLLGEELEAGKPAKHELEYYISISQPNKPVGGSEISRALIFPPTGAPFVYRDSKLNTDAWTRAYGQGQAVMGFVFCPRGISKYVFLATEKVVKSIYGIDLPKSALALSKQDEQTIDRAKRRLKETSFYSVEESSLLPLPEILKRGDMQQRIDGLARKFAAYQSPGGDNYSNIILPPYRRIENWLAQFDRPGLIETAVEILEATKLVTRQEVVHGISETIRQDDSLRNAIVCPIGGAKDSGSIVGYYAQDLVSEGIIKGAMSIEDALRHTVDLPIVLADDFCASGGQIREILGVWFDKPSLMSGLGEERLPLETQLAGKLRQRRVAFHFHAAWSKGVTALREALKFVGLHATISCTVPEDKIPFAFEVSTIIGDQDRQADFQMFAERCGNAILASQHKDELTNEDKKKIASRALGHGGRAMLLVFPYNVPSQTLTIVRESGTFEGRPWNALLRRRKKT